MTTEPHALLASGPFEHGDRALCVEVLDTDGHWLCIMQVRQCLALHTYNSGRECDGPLNHRSMMPPAARIHFTGRVTSFGII